MIGDVLNAKYFEPYVEKRDNSLPAAEFVGVVAVRELKGYRAAFLFDETGTRYDLPQFMINYANLRVALIARKFIKQVGEKSYNKLVVIRVKTLESISTTPTTAKPTKFSR